LLSYSKTEHNGVGIVPDMMVSPMIADLRAQRDTVLEAALQQILRPAESKAPRPAL
jgi:hypothetical protein